MRAACVRKNVCPERPARANGVWIGSPSLRRVMWLLPLEVVIAARRGRASRASSGTRRYLMLFPRTTSSGSFQKRSPSREVQITSRRQMFIQLSQLTRWPLYVSPFLSSTSMGCPCDVRRSERGSTIPRHWAPSRVLCAAQGGLDSVGRSEVITR